MEELDPKGDIWPYLGTFCCLQRVMIGELVGQRCWGKKNNLTKCMVAPHAKQKLPILKYQLCPGEALIYTHKTHRVLALSAQHYPRHACIRVKEKSFFPGPSLNYTRYPSIHIPSPQGSVLCPTILLLHYVFDGAPVSSRLKEDPGCSQCVDGGAWTMQWA